MLSYLVDEHYREDGFIQVFSYPKMKKEKLKRFDLIFNWCLKKTIQSEVKHHYLRESWYPLHYNVKLRSFACTNWDSTSLQNKM